LKRRGKTVKSWDPAKVSDLGSFSLSCAGKERQAAAREKRTDSGSIKIYRLKTEEKSPGRRGKKGGVVAARAPGGGTSKGRVSLRPRKDQKKGRWGIVSMRATRRSGP